MTASGQDDVRKLGELIRDIKIAMLTTEDDGGDLRSRPMATQQTEFDGDLWFFTDVSSPKVAEISHHQAVNVAYADPKKERYVSVSGRAELVRDRAKIEQLWNPVYKAWFPKGVDDPNIGLLKIHVEKAEYWDSPGSAVVHLIGFVKAIATGQRADIGENEKLEM